jgi:hypothetical protein
MVVEVVEVVEVEVVTEAYLTLKEAEELVVVDIPQLRLTLHQVQNSHILRVKVAAVEITEVI